jgi:hypothetical protein
MEGNRLWVVIDRKGELKGSREDEMKVKIQDAVEVISTTPGRAGKRDLMVSYTVDEARWYTLSIPIETISDAEGRVEPPKVMAEIKTTELERAKIIGQEFEV